MLNVLFCYKYVHFSIKTVQFSLSFSHFFRTLFTWLKYTECVLNSKQSKVRAKKSGKFGTIFFECIKMESRWHFHSCCIGICLNYFYSKCTKKFQTRKMWHDWHCTLARLVSNDVHRKFRTFWWHTHGISVSMAHRFSTSCSINLENSSKKTLWFSRMCGVVINYFPLDGAWATHIFFRFIKRRNRVRVHVFDLNQKRMCVTHLYAIGKWILSFFINSHESIKWDFFFGGERTQNECEY